MYPPLSKNTEPEILWWVGCAPATDLRAQKTAQAFAKILNTAGVNYAVLGKNEACTGDPARRAGREDIFFGLASQNVEILNEVKPKEDRHDLPTLFTYDQETNTQPLAANFHSDPPYTIN